MTQAQRQIAASEACSTSEPKAIIVPIPPDKVGDVKRLAMPYIDSTARYFLGRTSTSRLLLDCERGVKQLWFISTPPELVTGAGITEIQLFPLRKVCSILSLAGDRGTLEAVSEIIGQLEEWAASQGCDSIEVQGRAGWGRILPDYHETARVYVKELGDG